MTSVVDRRRFLRSSLVSALATSSAAIAIAMLASVSAQASPYRTLNKDVSSALDGEQEEGIR